MICEKCQTREATVFLTQVIDGEMCKVDLCEKCAREMGVQDASGFSLTNFLLDSGIARHESPKGLVCPQCGYCEQDLLQSGKLGCPHCYETFAATLSQTIHEIHRATNHRGKIPRSGRRQRPGVLQRRELEQALSAAIQAENYEQAARLRDQLRQLSTGD